MRTKITILLLLLCSGAIGQIRPTPNPFMSTGSGYLRDMSQAASLDALSDTIVRYANNPLGGMILNCAFRSIQKVSGTYYLYEEVSAAPWEIHVRTSGDGLHWSQKGVSVLARGASGKFDYNGQADPTVIYDAAGDWKMWYDALNTGSVWDSLGYATSTDGLTWSKYHGILGRGASGAWDDAWVHHPACIKYNGTYYLFYAGSRSSSNSYKIGVATSTDGIHWTKYASNPVISTGANGEWDDNYIRPSRPFKVGNTWYMTYWGHDGSVHSMGLASSPDLLTWTKLGKKFGSGSGKYDQVNPTASDNIVEDGIVKIWYTTVISSDGSLNYASMDITKGGDVLNRGIRTLGPFTTSAVKSLGDTVISTNSTASSAAYMQFSKVTASASFTANAVKIYIDSTSKPYTTYKFKVGLYTDNAGPKTLITTIPEVDWSSINGHEWNVFNFTTPQVLSAGSYWIAIRTNRDYYKAKAAGGANNWGFHSLAYAADWPTSLTPDYAAGAFSDVDVYLINNQTNVWQVALTSEPTTVYFDGKAGNKQISKALVDSDNDWYWTGNVLYVYSSADPNIKYQIGVPK